MRLLLPGALLCAAVAVGCDDDEKTSSSQPSGTATQSSSRKATAREVKEIRATVSRVEQAMGDGDAGAICRVFYSREAAQTEKDVGKGDCVASVRENLAGEPAPRLAPSHAITVSDRDRATATGGPSAGVKIRSSAAGRDPIEVEAVLVREGGSWRLDGSVLDFLVESGAGPGSGSSGGEEDGE